MALLIKAGTTSFRGFVVRILDASTGAPYTGATSATAGASFGYTRPGGTRQSITLSDLAAVDSAFSAGGIKHIANGRYRLDIPDAALAAGVNSVAIDGGFTSYVVVCEAIELVAVDLFDAIRMGLSALPNAAAGASGGLLVFGTGTGAINPAGGKVPATIAAGDAATLEGYTDTLESLGATIAAYVDTLEASAASAASALTAIQAAAATIQGYTDSLEGRLPAALEGGRMPAVLAATPPTAGEVADAVLDATTDDHATPGTIGAAIGDAGGAADPLTRNPDDYTFPAIGARMKYLGPGGVQSRSPMTTSGAMREILGGAAYVAAAGTQFGWVDTDDAWPELPDGTAVTWHAVAPNGETATAAAAIVNGEGADKELMLELDSDASAALEGAFVGVWSWLVWALLGDDPVPLVWGSVPVKSAPGP